jgi:hypothetical protein
MPAASPMSSVSPLTGVCKADELGWQAMRSLSIPSLVVPSLAALLLAVAPPVRGQASSQSAADVERRITESPGVTLQARFGKLALGSFHLEMTARQPGFDDAKKQVVIDEWRLTADLDRDNVSLVCNIKAAATGQAQTLKGWIIGEGRPGGVPYEMTGGRLDLSLRLQHQCWIRSYAWTPALSVAASGATPAGEEKIDGRVADKYNVEARPKALDRLRPLMNLAYSKGAAWLDRQTGALLKASIDYKERFSEPRGSDKLLGAGEGHVEMTVTRVGRVTVKLPKK